MWIVLSIRPNSANARLRQARWPIFEAALLWRTDAARQHAPHAHVDAVPQLGHEALQRRRARQQHLVDAQRTLRAPEPPDHCHDSLPQVSWPAPNLIDITVDGRPIKAVAQITKQGFTFVFDRATGEPIWPIEERPVPPSTVPGEHTSPTQPYPTKPPLYLTNGSLEEDLIDFTDELRAEALEIYRKHTAGPLYTPPALGGNIVRPGWSGGANWWDAAFDPETGRLYVPSWAHFSFVVMAPGDPANSDLTIRPQVSNLPGPRGLPLFKPPYSQLAALDLNAGEKLWSVPLGDGPRDHEALRGMDLPPLGNYEKGGGPLLTKTLLFIGQGIESNRLRAFDKNTGYELFEMELPARSSSAPISYLADGRQYIVLAVGGGADREQLVALALP